MLLKKILFGLATYVPGVTAFRAKTTGGTVDARYCYSVWLRHLVLAREAGLADPPRTVAELGPGDSLGIGLCALLTGAEQYVALDHVPFANAARNRQILQELADLLRRREPIPGPGEYPRIKPELADLAFPVQCLDADRLAAALDPVRVAELSAALDRTGDATSPVRYVAPWSDAAVVAPASIDLVVSQAVLEHVTDLPAAYAAMAGWLRPGGFMSHQIDFKSHGVAATWDGHWNQPAWQWRLIKGRRPYLLNREPWSVHRRLLDECGFEIVGEHRYRQPSNLDPARLKPRFAHLTEDDLTTAGVCVQAVKR